MKLVSWGANQFGQLAHKGWSLSEQCESPQTCDTTGLPEDIIEGLIQICGGGGHTLLLDRSGRVWACGLNSKGQCGAAATTQENIQRPWHQMDTGCLLVTQIAAGWEHTLALTSEGVLLGWGSNSHSQLGSLVQKGEQTTRAVQIAQGVQQMSAGLRHSAWVTSEGKLKSCGSLDATNIEIPELLLAKSVACGQRHSLVLIGSDEEVGQIWGWGDNRHGQLGFDPTECVKFPNLIPAKNLADYQFLDLKSGWSHAAAITGSGEVICWGRNTYGQLGKSPTDQKSTCVCWPTHYTENGQPTKAIQLALGSEHTMVQLDDGRLLTCGWNEHGNCGNGDMQDVHTPQVILRNCTLIGCGSAHSFALINDSFT